MKINRNNASVTILISAVYAFLLIVLFVSTATNIDYAQWIYNLISFIITVCISWIAIFIVGLLKSFNEKKIIANAFVIYLVISWIQFISVYVYQSIPYSLKLAIIFSATSSTVVVMVTVYLAIITFLIKNNEIKIPLLLFVLGKIAVMLFYSALPQLFRYLAEDFSLFNNLDFLKYFGYSEIMIPIFGFYIAKTALKLLNKSQNFGTTHYESFLKPDHPGENSTL